MKYRLIALDIGGVCLRIRPELCFGRLGYRSIEAVPPELLAAVDRLECGRMDEAEFLAVFRRVAGSALSDEAIRAAWCAILAEAMPGMTALVRELTLAGTKLVFFSDTSALHMTCFRENFPIAEFVPDGIYSFVVGAKKPSPAMFAAFEADYGKPDLYVDDREVCLSGAPAFGWPTHRFESAERLRTLLGLGAGQEMLEKNG